MSQDYILIHGLAPTTITASQEAQYKRDLLIDAAERIGAVTTKLQADEATSVLKDIKGFTRLIEGSRKEVSEPILALTRDINAMAKGLITELEAHAGRISQQIGAWQAEEQRKLATAERKAREEENRLLQEANEAQARLAASRKGEAAKETAAAAIEEKTITAIQQVRAETALAAAPKIAGLAAKRDLEVTVDDIRALYAARPELVTLTPNMQLIKGCIKAGQQLPGVTSREVTKAIVR